MINQQLVEYIKQQMQAGIARDAVKKALSDAGWPPADVDDSLRAAEPSGMGASASPATTSPAAQQTINPAVAMGAAEPSARSTTAASSNEKFFSQSAAAKASVVSEDHPQTKKFVVVMAVMGVVILLLVGALAFVYFNMSGQTGTPGAGANPAEITSLQQQVSQLTSERDTLSSQASELSLTNEDLTAELRFLMPAPTGASSTIISATIRGTLSGTASTTFILTTTHNLKVNIVNSANAAVSAALAPLAASSSAAILTGTHPAGSLNLTVTSVNGQAL